MDWIIALDKEHFTLIEDGTAIESDIIYIPPGKVALISLFGMTTKVELEGNDIVSRGCAEVIKLSYGTTPELSKEVACGSDRNLQKEFREALNNRTVKREPVFQCGKPWSLNPCNNYVTIPIPGFYTIRMDDVDQIESVYMEYALLDVTDSTIIPDDFKLGSGTDCGCVGNSEAIFIGEPETETDTPIPTIPFPQAN